MSHYHYLLQVSSTIKENIHYAIGLTAICLTVLVLLWLPDFLKNKED